MKFLTTLLTLSCIFVMSFQMNAQAYFGGQITIYEPSLVFQQEATAKFALMQTKTTINMHPTFQLKVGVDLLEMISKVKQPLQVIAYMPIMNLDLKTMRYNTPINGEMRYSYKDFLFTGGVELYTDIPVLYLGALVKFQ